MDADTIARNGEWIRVNQFAVYHVVSPRTGVKSVGAAIEIDCKRRVYRLVNFTAYEPDGSPRETIDDPENGAEHEMVPDSATDHGMKFICDNVRPGPRVRDPQSDAPS